ncbi:MAG: hypothetical protein ACPG7I_04230 [Spongiibacter marinus]
MEEQRFDLFLTGHLAVGSDRDRAVQQLAALFKRPPDQIDKLLRGRSSRIRKALNAAEVQRLQAGFDKIGILTEARPCPEGTPQQRAIAENIGDSQDTLSLCPTGSPVLRENERRQVNAVSIDTSALSLAQVGSHLQEPQKAAVKVPNTDHLHRRPRLKRIRD